MKCERDGFSRSGSEVACREALADAVLTAKQRFSATPRILPLHAGWPWHETADLATLAVAFGFAGVSSASGRHRLESLAADRGQVLR